MRRRKEYHKGEMDCERGAKTDFNDASGGENFH